MSLSTKQVTYCTEVDALLELVRVLIVDIKAKKTVGQDLQDLVAPFIAAVTTLGDLTAELADKSALAVTVELKLNQIVESLVA